VTPAAIAGLILAALQQIHGLLDFCFFLREYLDILRHLEEAGISGRFPSTWAAAEGTQLTPKIGLRFR
jgi:hypothetical protein